MWLPLTVVPRVDGRRAIGWGRINYLHFFVFPTSPRKHLQLPEIPAKGRIQGEALVIP